MGPRGHLVPRALVPGTPPLPKWGWGPGGVAGGKRMLEGAALRPPCPPGSANKATF